MATAEQVAGNSPGFLSRHIPIIDWLPHYRRSWLRGDIIAAATVWAVMVPQSLGYAGIIGVPVHHGLYTAAAALLIYAIFGSSRRVIVGPSSTTAAVSTVAIVSVIAFGSEEAANLAAIIALLAGLLYLVLSLLRMGWISNYLSQSVMIGFIFGIGLDVVIGQLGVLFGYPITGRSAILRFWDWLTQLSQTNTTTLLVGGIALVALALLRFFVPKVPGPLLALVYGIAVSLIFNVENSGVTLVGSIPTGLPAPEIPDWALFRDNYLAISTAAIGVLAVGFSESLAAARQYAEKYGEDVDVNQEMLAMGFTNAGAAFFQGFANNGSLSKSSVNDSAGANSQMASLIQGGFIILTMLVLARFFKELPNAVLAAIILDAVIFGLLNVKAMARLYRTVRIEFILAMASLLGVLIFGTIQGVLIGVVLSLIVLIARASNPQIPELGRARGTEYFNKLSQYPDSEQIPGLIIIRFDGPLYFASANALRERVHELIRGADEPVQELLLDMEAVNYVDLEGATMLHKVAIELVDQGLEMHLTRVDSSIIDLLQRAELYDGIGDARVHHRIAEAVDDYQLRYSRIAAATDASPPSSDQ